MGYELINLLADGDPMIAIAAIPITAMMIPILGIITAHRRKMAEIRNSRPAQNQDEVAAMRRELDELKEMVHTQMLALDRYARVPVAKSTDDEVQSRVRTGLS